MSNPQRKINVHEFMEDLRGGLDDAGLMQKYHLTVDDLLLVYRKLLSRGRAAGYGPAQTTSGSSPVDTSQPSTVSVSHCAGTSVPADPSRKELFQKLLGDIRAGRDALELMKTYAAVWYEFKATFGPYFDGSTVDQLLSSPAVSTSTKNFLAKTFGDHRNLQEAQTIKDVQPRESSSVLFGAKKSYSPQELYDQVISTVVGVKVESGTGSGFFLDSDGLLVTNRHVAGTNRVVTIRLIDGKECPGKIVCSFRDVDLAFVKADALHTAYVLLAERSDIKVGQTVYAIGHPFGLENTFTQGIVSGADRVIGGCRYLQTDASINPGNSGGPLFNQFGQIAGMNTMGFRESQGLGFAIPSDVIAERYASIRNNLAEIVGGTYCPICGKVSQGKQYCQHCGSRLE
jgi:serine protease Do